MTETEQSTETKPKRPRVTVNMVNQRVDDLAEASAQEFADLHSRLDKGNERFQEINDELEKLRRAKRGTTSAHARIASLEAEFRSIQGRYASKNSNPGDDPIVQQVDLQNAERINARLDELFGRLAGEDEAIREDIEKLQGTVAGHDVSINMLEEGQTSLNERVDHVDGRVSKIEQLREKFPWWQIAAALAVGIIVFAFWRDQQFTQTYVLGDGSTKVVSLDVPNSVWFAVLVGIVSFALALGLLLLLTALFGFVKTKLDQRKEQKERKEQAELPPVPDAPPSTPVVTTTPAPASDTAPTTVLVTTGAANGAH